ncbi:unnamed protein product [Somion occarium]|uniref:Uncharacterized protein n=1 Tax=Somion occarium TaxID=3059160 RepID=A0ABP1D7S7_9APHY
MMITSGDESGKERIDVNASCTLEAIRTLIAWSTDLRLTAADCLKYFQVHCLAASYLTFVVTHRPSLRLSSEALGAAKTVSFISTIPNAESP